VRFQNGKVTHRRRVIANVIWQKLEGRTTSMKPKIRILDDDASAVDLSKYLSHLKDAMPSPEFDGGAGGQSAVSR
jgi:hypothetical protein